MKDRNESLASTTKDLMWAEAFWGLFLIGLRKSWSSQIPTACVSKNGINYGLTINEDFWESLERNFRMGILQHEAIHIGYFHIERWDEFEDKELANIAADIVVNQDCRPEWLPCKNMTKEQFAAKFEPIMESIKKDMESKKITKEEAQKEMLKIPPRGVYFEDFAEMKLKPKQGMQYYYDALKKEKEKGGGGNKYLQSLLGSGMAGEDGPLGHGLWKEFENLSEAEQKLLKSQLDYQLKEVAEQVQKSRGIVPSNIAQYLEGLELEEPPKFDWKGYLRRFTGGSTKTFIKRLRRKYNKRFEDNPGIKIKSKRHVLLAVDTSGSVSDEELKEFFQEIGHISKTGTMVTVVQCDAAISDISTYKDGMKLNNKQQKIKIHGRGGTSFDPPVDYFNENWKKFTCMIYFTDGECPPPQNPCRGKLLWVLSARSNPNKELPGYTIQLPK